MKLFRLLTLCGLLGFVCNSYAQTGPDSRGQAQTKNPVAGLAGIDYGTSCNGGPCVQEAKVDSSGNVSVTVTNGASGGTSSVDEGAFTQGTTSFTPAGCYYSSSPVSLTSGQAGAILCTATRHAMVSCDNCSAGGGSTTPADAFTNPTTAGISMTFNAGYNGSTWDLLRSGDKNNVAGITGVLNTSPVGRYNATQPTLTDTRYNMLQLSQRGELYVSPGVSLFPVQATLAAETTKVIGTVNQGTSPWVISGALTDTQLRATPVPVSGTVTVTDGSGALNVIVDSGTTTVTQSTGTNLHAVLDSGTTTVTQGTGTNLHTVVDSGTITAVTGITNALPAGSNVIGHVIQDSGSTTAVTGTVTVDGSGVTQPVSATSLPLPTGASTSALQTTGNATLVSLLANTPTLINGRQPVTVLAAPNLVYNTQDIGSPNAPNGKTVNYGGIGACEYSGTLPSLRYGDAAHTQCDNLGRQFVHLGQIDGTVPAVVQDGSGIKPVYDHCQANSKIFGTFSTTANVQIITGAANKKVYFCSWNDQLAGTAEAYAVVEGTGSTCATGVAAFPGMSGGTTAAGGWNTAANGGRWGGTGGNEIGAMATAGDNACILKAAAVQLSGGFSYVLAN